MNEMERWLGVELIGDIDGLGITKGKRYSVVDTDGCYVIILDDAGDEHRYDTREGNRWYYGRWFILREGNEE